MNYQAYQELFEQILTDNHPLHPYDEPSYLNYTRLNQSRMKRWDKHLVLNEQLVEKVKGLTAKQRWIILTEPWCGDAAHIIPFLMQLAAQNTLVTYDIQLRDSPPFLIESYLTGTSKSIPKLIVRDEDGGDIFTWGPRPAEAQLLFNQLKLQQAGFEESKITLQNWYNADKGISLCNELLTLFERPSPRKSVV